MSQMSHDDAVPIREIPCGTRTIDIRGRHPDLSWVEVMEQAVETIYLHGRASRDAEVADLRQALAAAQAQVTDLLASNGADQATLTPAPSAKEETPLWGIAKLQWFPNLGREEIVDWLSGPAGCWFGVKAKPHDGAYGDTRAEAETFAARLRLTHCKELNGHTFEARAFPPKPEIEPAHSPKAAEPLSGDAAVKAFDDWWAANKDPAKAAAFMDRVATKPAPSPAPRPAEAEWRPASHTVPGLCDLPGCTDPSHYAHGGGK